MQLRLRGYQAGLRQHRLALEPALVAELPDLAMPAVAKQVATLLALDAKAPDAIIAANDYVAAMAIRCLNQAGKAVPGDVAVVGFDNLNWSGITTPALTTVDQNTGQLSLATLQVLLAMVERRKETLAQASIIIKPSLVVREST